MAKIMSYDFLLGTVNLQRQILVSGGKYKGAGATGQHFCNAHAVQK